MHQQWQTTFFTAAIVEKVQFLLTCDSDIVNKYNKRYYFQSKLGVNSYLGILISTVLTTAKNLIITNGKVTEPSPG